MLKIKGIIALTTLLVGCNEDRYDPIKDEHTGKEAKSLISRNAHVKEELLPKSAKAFYLLDSGTFNGVCQYWSFSCETTEECFDAIKTLNGPDKNAFKQWEKPDLAILRDGPQAYWPELQHSPWDIRNIRNGYQTCLISEDKGRLEYYAIDSDRKIVYHHKSTGGYPETPAAP